MWKLWTIRPVWAAVAAVAALASPVRGQEADFDIKALAAKVEPCVCAVTVRNAAGLPLAHATGFLMGQGGFVVTDLSALAQPGASDALVRFGEGVEATVREFGLADAVLGVAVVRIAEGAPETPGLGIVSDPEAIENGARAAMVGWRWSEDRTSVIGRIEKGGTAAALASRLGMASPAKDLSLLAYDGPVVGGATGAPVVDAEGRVLGVWLDLADPDGMNVVVPAPALRAAMLAERPSLRPLVGLPKPVWPVRVRPLAGEPPTPQQFAVLVRGMDARCRCKKCEGSGKIAVRRVVSSRVVGGLRHTKTRLEPETCPTCKGEGVLFADDTYDLYAKAADVGTRLRLEPGLDVRTASAARVNALEMLKHVADVGQTFRNAMAGRAALALGSEATELPCGFVVYAQALETFDGPDGSYVRLAPYHGSVSLAMRLGEADDGETAAPWSYGKWVVLAGLSEARFEWGGRRYVHTRPLSYVPGPYLGRPPRRPPERPEPDAADPGKADSPDTPADADEDAGEKPEDDPGNKPREKKPGDPDFFGL